MLVGEIEKQNSSKILTFEKVDFRKKPLDDFHAFFKVSVHSVFIDVPNFSLTQHTCLGSS